MVNCISVFSGAGGLDVGAHQAGARIIAYIENDADAAQTLRLNTKTLGGEVFEDDVQNIDFRIWNTSGPDILIGGPPCQPFSKNGYWVKNDNRLMENDPRNMLGQFIRALGEMQPSGFLFENVESILHPTNKGTFEAFVKQAEELGYTCTVSKTNSADFGVPQKRKRVFVFGIKGMVAPIPLPKGTYADPGKPAGMNNHAPYVGVGDFIAAYSTPEFTEPQEDASTGTYYQELLNVPSGRNYIGLRDVEGYKGRTFRPGSRFWNFLYKLHPDQPSITIAAQPGPWVGPFHWENRRLRVPEIAAIQTFPDDYQFYGSYYTPTDVADFFWREFFIQNDILDAESAISFLNKYHFIEPACGAGALVFSFLKQLTNLDVPLEQLAKIKLSVIDINTNTLGFTEQKIRTLASFWNITFERINFICGNFLDTKFNNEARPCFFFGNPPFVANKKGQSSWKNIYADFLEKALKQAGKTGNIHFIVPLSVTFSRDYSFLRKMIMDTGGTIRLSNFDNVPDTLFKSGKPAHTNTNKANSQRCTILTVLPEQPRKVLSTPLLRWARKDRSNLLGQSPEYLDISDYDFDQQFPRPENRSVLDYLELAAESPRLGTLVIKNGRHTLLIAGVARNYISFREEPGNGVHTLNFNSEKNFLLGLSVLSSDLFFSYWRSLGDGFHLTKGNILGFPLHYKLVRECERNAPEICRIWKTRQRFRKEKFNSGQIIRSFDLGNIVPSLVNHELNH